MAKGARTPLEGAGLLRDRVERFALVERLREAEAEGVG
jgi:hypothetical protein